MAATAADTELLEHAWQEVQPEPARRLLIAAIQTFAAKGYHATTTRDISARAALSPAGMYVHFRTKEELLYRIALIGHRHSLAVLNAAATRPAVDAAAQLQAVIGDFAAHHARYHTAARVIEYEQGALTTEHRAEIVVLRHEIDEVVRRTLMRGVADEVFDVPDVAGTALALLSLTVDVARWYRDDGRRSPEDVGRLYADLALRMVRI